MGKPKAPKAPDYAAAATAQGDANREAAITTTNLNRANQITPEGQLTWSMRPGADPNNPQAGDYTQTVALSPEQQRLYDLNNQISTGFMESGIEGLGRVNDIMQTPFQTSGLPALSGAPQMQQRAQAGAPVSGVGAGNTATSFDSSGIRSLPGQVDDASRQRVEEAMLSRLEPQFQRDQSDLESRLLNSGIERGTEGWNREMDRIDRARNDARMQAVLAGGSEESRQVGLNQGLQGQEFSQSLAGQQFGQQGVGQDFSQRLASGGFANQAQAQQFQQQQAVDQLVNAFMMQGAGVNNAARAQGVQEQAFTRQLPINEINALRTGSQMQGPSFQGYYTGGSAQAAPLFDAMMAQGNYDLQRYQNEMAGSNALLGGLAGMGSAAITKFSDRRLKSNIVQVGALPSGLAIYEYDIFGRRERGVLADEAARVFPAAVRRHSSGFLTVDYARLS